MTSSIAAIHVAKKQLGLDDDTYRAKLANITGKSSVKDMTEAQRQKVLTVFRNEGFKPVSKSSRDGRPGKAPLDGKYLAKMRAMWIALYNLAVVDDPKDSAIEAFALERQVKNVDAIRFIHYADDGAKVIDGMKAMLTRAGVDWSDPPRSPEYSRRLGYKVARAQWAKLWPQSPQQFWPAVTDLLDVDETTRDLSDKQWIEVMNYLGKRIRAEKKMLARKGGA